MMNTRCLRLIAIAILISCVVTDRLTTEENEKRIANCGKSKLPAPKKGEGQEGFRVEFNKDSYVVKVQPLEHTSNAATGFFISPRHILTSSQSVFNEKRQWLADEKDSECVSTMKVPPDYADQIQVLLHKVFNDGDTKEVFKIRNATLLAFCRRDIEYDRFFSPMLVELEEDLEDIQFPCVADSTTEIKEGDVVHAYRWQFDVAWKSYYFKRKIEEIHSDFLQTDQKQPAAFVRGGPLVKHDTSVGTLAIGIDATNGYVDRAKTTYYDNIKALENDLCKHAGVCASSSPSTTTEVATTPEEETTTSDPDVQISSVSSGPSTPKPTKKPSVTSKSKNSTTPPQRSIDEYEVNPADILYDEEKRREGKEDLDNDFFVTKDFKTNGKSGICWMMGTLAVVFLV